MLPIRTILHPTDFSEKSDYAFHLACSLARDHDARLMLLHVVEPPMGEGVEGLLIVAPLSPAYKKELEARLARLQGAAPDVPMDWRLEEGFPGAEIVRAAADSKADMIIMGTHGRTGLGRLVLGSVAEEVLRKAPCPVLTLKSEVPAAEPAKVTAVA